MRQLRVGAWSTMSPGFPIGLGFVGHRPTGFGDRPCQIAPPRTSEVTLLWLALYQPDIAANAAAALRLAACLDLPLVVVEPTGFVWDRRRLARVGLDYAAHARLARLPSWAAFEAWREEVAARLVLLSTRAATPYCELVYRADDVLLAGRESAGVPERVHARADCRVRVPMAPGRRSLNVVTALAMVAGEALRQTQGFAND